MEPRNDTKQSLQTPPPRTEEKKKRFQIVKLEERIAPDRGGIGHGDFTHQCTRNGCGA